MKKKEILELLQKHITTNCDVVDGDVMGRIAEAIESNFRDELVKFGKWYSMDEASRTNPERWTSIVNRYLY